MFGLAALFGGTKKRKARGSKRLKSSKRVHHVKRSRGTRKGMRRKSVRRAGLRLAYDFAKPRHY